MNNQLKFGLDTFGDIQKNESGNFISAAETLRMVLEQGQYADSLGIDFFNIGEHRRVFWQSSVFVIFF